MWKPSHRSGLQEFLIPSNWRDHDGTKVVQLNLAWSGSKGELCCRSMPQSSLDVGSLRRIDLSAVDTTVNIVSLLVFSLLYTLQTDHACQVVQAYSVNWNTFILRLDTIHVYHPGRSPPNYSTLCGPHTALLIAGPWTRCCCNCRTMKDPTLVDFSSRCSHRHRLQCKPIKFEKYREPTKSTLVFITVEYAFICNRVSSDYKIGSHPGTRDAINQILFLYCYKLNEYMKIIWFWPSRF